MEIRSIRYFLAVADELHFGRAAKRLNMSQPPLSQQIMKLEEELEVALFIRDKRNVRLTKAGERLRRHCENISNLVKHAVEDVRAVSKGRRGMISVGYVGPAMDSCLPSFLSSFKKEYPGVKVLLKQLNTKLQLEQIRNGILDLGFVRLYEQDTSDFQIYTVHQETYCAAIPDGHVCAVKNQLTLKEILKEPLVFYPRTIQPGLYDEWFKVFRKTGIVPRIAEEAESYQTILSLVAAGFGFGIVPGSTALLNRPGVAVVPINEKIPELVITACHLTTSDNPVVSKFVNHIIEQPKLF